MPSFCELKKITTKGATTKGATTKGAQAVKSWLSSLRKEKYF